MLFFGVAVSAPETYESQARPGIERARESDSVVLTRLGYDSIQQPYNEMLAEAGSCEDLEALILLHQDVELVDGSLPARIRPHLRDPAVGVVGALAFRGADPGRPGAVGFRMQSAAGRPRGSGPGSPMRGHGHSDAAEDAELIDGVLMALAPWVVRTLRFDERFADRFHCYDLDLSLRVRAAGGRLVCDPIPHIHHMATPWRDRDELIDARVAFARAWDPDVRPPQWAPAFQI